MENLQPGEDSGSSDVAGEIPDSTFQLNIITLDSQNFCFHVDKNILVSAFKEKIASQVSVPVGKQRLLFRGKVLKDEHLLSEYNVENGDTLHIVERKPPPPPGPNTPEPTSVNITGGHDSHAGGTHNRIGQAGHGVVLVSGVSGSSGVAAESSDSTFQLNIMTSDSMIFSFHVDKNILVSALKEEIASHVSVPAGQQHLIFRGMVLEDDHVLSEYNIEHGHTLQLVERQPQSPPGSGMLGLYQAMLARTFLDAMSIGNLVGNMQPGVQTPHGNETERSQTNAGGQVLHGQSASNPMQNPVRTATTFPSLNTPFPLQTSPLSGGSGGVPPSHTPLGPFSGVTRNQDIHAGNTNSDTVGQHVFQSLPSVSMRGDASRQNTNNVADAMPQGLGSSSLDVLLARVSQQTGASPIDMLRHIAQQITQSPDLMNFLHQMDNRDLVGITSETLRGMLSASHPNPPREQVFSENRDMNGYPQVDLRDAVRRVGIISPEEILFNLVHVAVRPSNLADTNLVNEICSQSERAMGFMMMVLSELSRRMEERGRL